MLFPSGIGFYKVDVSSNAPSYVSTSQSLKTTSVSTGAQRWELSLSTVYLTELEYRKVWAFLNSLSGKAKAFDIKLPLFSKPLGIVTGTVQAMASYSAGNDNVSITNFNAEIGDFMRFAGHSKTYQVTSVAGNSVTIFPNLISSVGSSEVVQVENMLFHARLNSSISKVTLSSGKEVTRLKFKIIEVF